ncbi:NUDIX domain-containing protein [Rhizobium vallis]|uniref:NUDIX domain-containing protein n=1 Tax=Rhizobium vallis TaxID=634290 RepID=A0A432PED7_9HYPH|nr:NUDIX hydrolase [Rhizobium vallis]RUM22195.1 NUDIX domain-containing protein [Rhizobium vallis]
MNRVATHLTRLAGHTRTILEGGSIQQYGALCFRRTADDGVEVLLVTTRETGRWTIPKGWSIKGLAPHEVAEREAWEEAGVKGRAKKRVFGHFAYIKSLEDGREKPAFVEVHLLDVRGTKKRFPECEERKLAWMSPAEAASAVNEPELKSLLRRMEKHVTP